MNKKYYAAFSVILMLILITSMASAISIVKAQTDDNFFSANLYTTNWLDYNGNDAATSTAFYDISNLFSQPEVYLEYYDDYLGWYLVPCGPSYGEINNWGSSWNPSDLYSQITSDIANYPDFSTVLYVGHGGPLGFYGYSDDPTNPDDPPSTYAQFSEISSLTASSPAYQFVFNWVCMGANDAPQGSPSAWDPMWWNDQSALPYTWIGFNNFSPWLIDDMGTTGSEGIPNIYQYWLVFYYYYALQYGNTVMDSLNYASQMTGFSSFGSCVLSTGYYCYWPYTIDLQGAYFGPGYYYGNMCVCGDPLDTYILNSIIYDG